MNEYTIEEYRKEAEEASVKRNYRDGLFCTLFSEPKYALDLYRMFHPDEEVTEEDIIPITTDSIFAKGTVSDVAFQVKNHTFFLIEAQTSWTGNIIVRCLLYVAKFYMEYFTNRNRDLHRTKSIEMPIPEVYVYYAGDKEMPDVISFADIYGKGHPICLDLKVRVIKTPPSDTFLGQYDDFCGRCKAAVEKGPLTRKVRRGIIDACIEESILSDFLGRHRSELMDMLKGYWDIEGIRQVEDEELREQVTKDVTAHMVEQEEVKYVLRLKSQGIDSIEIAKLLMIPLEKVKSILNEN